MQRYGSAIGHVPGGKASVLCDDDDEDLHHWKVDTYLASVPAPTVTETVVAN